MQAIPISPGQFTEDGSFIGQYVPGKLQPPVSPQPLNNSASAHQAGAAAGGSATTGASGGTGAGTAAGAAGGSGSGAGAAAASNGGAGSANAAAVATYV
ncbi:hypothetical protein KR074_003293 [Drosophila pseudoananassae]|nr:hypothetical protein KR074_003293 [Drosophila pseudoananassae]